MDIASLSFGALFYVMRVPDIKIDTGRLQDRRVQSASEGEAIAIPYGTTRLAGNIIWATDLIETRHKKTYDGGLFGGDTTVITYTYSVHLAVALGAGPLRSLRRIWYNAELIWDGGVANSKMIAAVRFYPGDETQTPDSLIQSYETAAKTPPFRGVAYVVLQGLQLAKAGNRVPTLMFEVDGNFPTYHYAGLTRDSETYSLKYFKKPIDYPATDVLTGSPWEFTPLSCLPSSFTDATPPKSYSEIITALQGFASAYPGEAKYDMIGTSYGGRNMGALRVWDDGEKPIILFSHGIHGDERNFSPGLLQALTFLFTNTTDPVIDFARRNFSIYVIGTVNPDGMELNTRNNGNNVNLNRNWPYYWDHSRDADKGAYPSSEPEVRNVQAWLDAKGRVERVLVCLDLHGWESRTSWGFLTEQMYHDVEVQRTQRAAYLYIQHLLSARSWSGQTWINGRPALTEFRSARKPYIYTWVANRTQMAEAWCGLIEYPLAENCGVASTVFLDIFKGLLMAAGDTTEGNRYGALLLPAQTVLNNNSLMEEWHSTEPRPQWFSANGLRLTHRPAENQNERDYVISYRPESAGWPYATAAAGSALVATGDPATDRFVMAGGINAGGGAITSTISETLTDGAMHWTESLPKSAQYGAMCYADDGYLYFAGGYNATDGYLAQIWRTPAANPGPWELWHTMAVARQRHSLNFWRDAGTNTPYLVIAMGRDSAAYRGDVLLINMATKAETTIATVALPRGYHTAAIYNNTLYLFGGYDTASKTTVDKIALPGGTVTAGTALLFSRHRQGIAVTASKAYLCCGMSGSSTFSSVYCYDMASDTITTISYTRESIIDDDGNETPIELPQLASPACYIHPVDNYLAIVGGADETGVARDNYYEMDIDTQVMTLRLTDNTYWGYIRPTATFYGAAGDQFCVQAAVRNGQDVSEVMNPYVRITVIIGPLSSPSRTLRLGYTVPPQDDFHTFTLPFALQAGETEFRAYLRHYGAGTKVHLGAFQVVASAFGGRIHPQDGAATDAFEVTFRDPLKVPTPSGYSYVSGLFSPSWGSQVNVDAYPLIFVVTPGTATNGGTTTIDWVALYGSTKLLTPTPLSAVSATKGGVPLTVDVDYTVNLSTGEFAAKAGGQIVDGDTIAITYTWQATSELSSLKLRYVAAEDTLNPEAPTGNFRLEWRKGTTDYSYTFATSELNHARLNREWRRDMVHWRLEKGPRNGISTPTKWSVLQYQTGYTFLRFTLWYYGKQESVDISCTGTVAGYTSTGSGIVAPASRNLGNIVSDICCRAGFASSDIHVADLSESLSDVVGGYVVDGGNARDALDDLVKLAFFDMVEDDSGGLRAVKRGRHEPVAEIDQSELILTDTSLAIAVTKAQEGELPRKITIGYLDRATDYQSAVRGSQREAVTTRKVEKTNLPIAMGDEKAQSVADITLYSRWAESTDVEFSTGHKYSYVEPADRVALVYGATRFLLRVLSRKTGKKGIRFKACTEDPSIYDERAVDRNEYLSTTVELPGATIAHFLDLPALLPAHDDDGFYLAGAGDSGGWTGADVYRSQDTGATWQDTATIVAAGTIGTTATALAACPTPQVWDEINTVDVQLIFGALATESDLAVYNGANVAIIDNEVVQFRTATLLGVNQYRLSGLLRGRFGTEAEAGATHVSGSRFVLFDASMLRLYTTPYNREDLYRAVTFGNSLIVTDAQKFRNTAAARRCWSPVHISGSRDGSQNLTITWVRRARIDNGWQDSVDVPLVETAEAYEIDIIKLGVAVRTLTASTPTVAYSAADQVADFGAAQSSVTLRIYQLGAYGRGNAGEATL